MHSPDHRKSVPTLIRFFVIFALFVVHQLTGQVWAGATETLRFVVRANEAFEKGQGAWGVQLDQNGAVALYDRVLVEDDGPGIGSDADWLKTDRAPVTEIAGDTRIKKVLHVERLGAKEARLCVPSDVNVEVNGQPLSNPDLAPFPEVPVSRLKEGDNEIILGYAGGKQQHVKIALPEDILRNAPERKGFPRRSFKSVDGGKTWETISGEYMVRLHLIQHVPEGNFISPVMDLGQRDTSPLLTPVSVRSVSLRPEADTPPGTRMDLVLRTGRSPVYETTLWSDWQPISATVPKENRYLQWKAKLVSSDPLKTPLLRRVTVEAQVEPQPAPAWASALRVGSVHNKEVRYTSMPFEYENPRHPHLVALRQKYKLDEVISGAATETEQLVKLRDWVAHQWKFQPPAENYPAWDADEILTRKCGFCVQYAIVLMQYAISLGHQARFAFGHNPSAFDGGGHEVCEIWSNEHRKWIFFDVNLNWTLNQVCFDATPADPPGAVSIQMGTVTPYFDTFLKRVDQQAWQESPRAFTWSLHRGLNHLEMRARNQAGIQGPISSLEVEYRYR